MANRNHRKQITSRGFSILESLVAIAILLIATTGPMVFAQQSLRAARLSRDQVTAFYLAQDAVEFVKHVRDENSLTDIRANWLVGLEECFADEGDSNSGCQISSPEWLPGSTDAAVDPCPGADCPLYEQEIDGGNGKLYGIFGGGASVESRFSRRVRLMTPEGDDPAAETEEVLVEVEVTWGTAGIEGERRVLVREHIYNWIQ
jgi:prepilin-type N-terminal cleavage/methylation domain-containing protein